MTEQEVVNVLGIYVPTVQCLCTEWMCEEQHHCAWCKMPNNLYYEDVEIKPERNHAHKWKWSLSGKERKEINDRFESNAH